MLRACASITFLGGLLMFGLLVDAQEPPGGPRLRKLAPGVTTTIPYAAEEAETYSGPRPFVDAILGKPQLDWKPFEYPRSSILLEKAGGVIQRRDVWNLEFTFKPLRMIRVDVPEPSGRMERQLIWYLVYKVENKGSHLRPVEERDQWDHVQYKVEKFDGPKLNGQTPRFFPIFILEAYDVKKSYQDRVIPAAQAAIQIRERPGVKLLNSVEITRVSLGPGESAWGVATWQTIDPRIDFFSIYIQGLTNAYKFQDNYRPGTPPGTGRKFIYKTLQLNFWRPGDAVRENEEEIQYGIPLYKDPKQQAKMLAIYGLEQPVDFRWIYR